MFKGHNSKPIWTISLRAIKMSYRAPVTHQPLVVQQAIARGRIRKRNNYKSSEFSDPTRPNGIVSH